MRQPTEITGELLASGLTVAQTALLMELVLSMSTGLSTGQGGETSALEKRRAWDRDRQARKREAERLARESAKSTGHPPDSTGRSGGQNEIDTNMEEKEEGLQLEEKKKVNKKGSRLSPGTQITEDLRNEAIECGCPVDRVDRLWVEFVDYWSEIPGTKGCKLSWKGTWRNRVRQVMGWTNGQGTNGHRGNTAAQPRPAREDAILTGMGNFARRYLAEKQSARSDDGATFGFMDAAPKSDADR